MTRERRTLRRAAAAASVLVLGLAACGQNDEQISEPALQAPIPVRVAAGGSVDARSASPAASEAAGDMMIAPWIDYDYVLGEGLPDLPDEASGWQYVSGVEPDADLVARIAAALGVDGELVAQPEDVGGGWIVGPNDGSAAALYVARDGQLTWYYSMAYAVDAGTGRAGSATGCVEPVVVDSAGVAVDASESAATGTDVAPMPPDVATEPCIVEEPQPPAGILSDEEARARVLALFDEMGVDPARFELEVDANEWYASATAYQVLGGRRSPVAWYFGFGAGGKLESASGVLASPVEVGPYPLIGYEEAVTRLDEQMFGYGPMLRGAVAETTGGVAAGAEPALGVPDVACDPAADCIPSDSMPEPQTVTVTLVDARMDLWWTWDLDGTVWLLPAYTFTDSDGGEHTVAAVTDEYLVVEEPVVEPMPVETAPGAPAPPPSDVVIEPKPGVEDSVPTNTIENPDGGGVAVISDTQAATLVGLTEQEARKLAESNGWELRIGERDGEVFAGTSDYRTDRVTVVVTAGVVTVATVG
jgi:hypothetical protein